MIAFEVFDDCFRGICIKWLLSRYRKQASFEVYVLDDCFRGIESKQAKVSKASKLSRYRKQASSPLVPSKASIISPSTTIFFPVSAGTNFSYNFEFFSQFLWNRTWWKKISSKSDKDSCCRSGICGSSICGSWICGSSATSFRSKTPEKNLRLDPEP